MLPKWFNQVIVLSQALEKVFDNFSMEMERIIIVFTHCDRVEDEIDVIFCKRKTK